MAKPEQTEKPTPKRRSEARDRGQIAKSQDLSQAVVFTTVIIALHTSFTGLLDGTTSFFGTQMAHITAHRDLGAADAGAMILAAFRPFAGLIVTTFASAMILGIVASVAQTGLTFNLKKLKPNFGIFNVLAGLQRIFFSPQTLVNLTKQFVKLGAVVCIVYYVLHDKVALFYALARAQPRDIALTVEGLLYQIGIRFGVVLFILSIADYAWEKRRLEQSLKMSKAEVKDEAKQSEGSSEAKGAVRQRRQQARRRMMAAVPKATVVVTNPTHFAVALMWDDVKMDAPVVVAKGADLIARRIKQVAAEHDVPIMENPPLARTLYDKVPMDSPIPPNLYSAVAQVIAFVYRLKNKTIA